MRDHDAADSPLASHWPDIASQTDSLLDVLREELDAFRGPLPQCTVKFHGLVMRLVAAALRRLHLHDRARDDAGATDTIVPVLRLLARDHSDRTLAIRAAELLKLLNKSSKSHQQIADEHGVTRACTHTHYRDLQRRTGLRGRSDKSDAARAGCVQRTLGKRRPRRLDKWPGFALYEQRAR